MQSNGMITALVHITCSSFRHATALHRAPKVPSCMCVAAVGSQTKLYHAEAEC